jgi:hypothetical protein
MGDRERLLISHMPILSFFLSVLFSQSGVYDTEYLDYIRKLLSLLPRYGMTALVVMHHDVWSRYSGGSGAPAWTLEVVGFDLHAIEAAGAAWLQEQRGGGNIETEKSIWPSGYQKLIASTMKYLNSLPATSMATYTYFA